MTALSKNTAELLEPNWDLRQRGPGWAGRLIKLFPRSAWKRTAMPDTRRVNWALSELGRNGGVGDDFIEIQRGERGAWLRVYKDGGGIFSLVAGGGPGQYLICAKRLCLEETGQIVGTYNAGKRDWMYSSRWEEAGLDATYADDDKIDSADDPSWGGGTSALVTAGFLPAAGMVGLLLGAGGGGYFLGIAFLTAVASAILFYPVFAGRIMEILDGREVQDDEGGFFRIS